MAARAGTLHNPLEPRSTRKTVAAALDFVPRVSADPAGARNDAQPEGPASEFETARRGPLTARRNDANWIVLIQVRYAGWIREFDPILAESL